MSDQLADQYYTRFRGKVLGPFDIVQVRSMIERNQVTRLHELSPDGEVWKRLRDMPELRPGGASSPGPSVDVNPKAKTEASAHVVAPLDLSTLAPADDAPAPLRRLGDDAAPHDVMSGPKWYYALGQQKVGPVTADMLRTMSKQGNLDAGTLVWREGLPDWVSLKEAGFAKARTRPIPPTVMEQAVTAVPAAGRVVASGSDQYAMVPWIRRASVQRVFVILSLLCVPILILIPFFVVLTGEVYQNNYDAQGQLKRWGRSRRCWLSRWGCCMPSVCISS